MLRHSLGAAITSKLLFASSATIRVPRAVVALLTPELEACPEVAKSPPSVLSSVCPKPGAVEPLVEGVEAVPEPPKICPKRFAKSLA